jgi:hypothetical protein
MATVEQAGAAGGPPCEQSTEGTICVVELGNGVGIWQRAVRRSWENPLWNKDVTASIEVKS